MSLKTSLHIDTYSAHKAQSNILGHRGARDEILENSQIGFEHTHKLTKKGIAGIEFDVQLTHDGKLLVFHDQTISRLYHRQGRVNQLPVSFFNKHPIWYNNTPHQMLTLDMMPKLLQGYRHIELEVKTHSRTNHRQLIKVLKSYLTDFPTELPVCITSFDTKLLAQLRTEKTLSSIAKGLLIDQPMPRQALVNQAMRLGCSQVGVEASLISPKLIKHCHDYQLSVTAWTVNNLAQAKYLLGLSVDYIITDKPSYFLLHL